MKIIETLSKGRKTRCQKCNILQEKDEKVIYITSRMGARIGTFHHKCFLETFYPKVIELANEDWKK